MPRWLHRWYATLTGSGWYMCLCGREFGGHEASGVTVQRLDGLGRMPVCGRCSLERYQRGPADRAERLE